MQQQTFSRNEYILTPVRCPGEIEFADGEIKSCTVLIDRREVDEDKAVHENKCMRCDSLYVYRFNERGELVVLSMTKPPPKKRSRQR